MTPVREPKTVTAATKLLEEYADLANRIDLVEADRADAVTTANQRADLAARPMAERMEQISGALAAWWAGPGQALAGDKKSAELGGCKIGLRTSRPKLAHGFDSDDKAIEALRSTRLFKQTTRISYSLDRGSTLKLLQLGGKAGGQLASLGFSSAQDELFFVERSA